MTARMDRITLLCSLKLNGHFLTSSKINDAILLLLSNHYILLLIEIRQGHMKIIALTPFNSTSSEMGIFLLLYYKFTKKKTKTNFGNLKIWSVWQTENICPYAYGAILFNLAQFETRRRPVQLTDDKCTSRLHHSNILYWSGHDDDDDAANMCAASCPIATVARYQRKSSLLARYDACILYHFIIF